MNKKIITIAEIVFALVFVVMLAIFMATINSKGNDANTNLVNTLESTTGTSISNYENLDKVKGTVVENAVKNYTTISSTSKITIAVQTRAMAKTGSEYLYALYGYDGVGNTHPAYNAKSTYDWYINPTADFLVEVIKNNNDVAVGIAFKQIDGTNSTMDNDEKEKVTEYLTTNDNLGSTENNGIPTHKGGTLAMPGSTDSTT